MRCTQLKATLRETKSFFCAPAAAVIVPVKGKDGMSIVDSEDEEDDVYEDEELEESWTEQSADIRDSKGRQLFEGKESDDLDSTDRHLLVKAAVAVKPNPYYNLHDAPSPSGRLSDRIERLRQRCVEALGKGAFEDAYSYLKQQEDVSGTL